MATMATLISPQPVTSPVFPAKNGVCGHAWLGQRLARPAPTRPQSLRHFAVSAKAKSNIPGESASDTPQWLSRFYTAAAATSAALLLFASPSPANAVDSIAVCKCLLGNCRAELARCVADPGCAANLACLNTCNNRPDETECQLKCGDLFENRVVDEFNKCAISKGGCVPQKANDGTFRVPSWDAVVPSFSTLDLNGDWYITAGLNPSFDTFDCQRHTFSARQEGKMSIHIRWRTPTIDGGFVTRETDQNFVADPDHPGALYNHDNEFLHYQDDWYIVDAKVDGKPDDYFIVYYKGKNDAWDGYGGATIYTRSKTLPEKYKYNYQVALRRVGVSFDKMIITDNSCPPLQPLPLRLEKVIEKEEMVIAEELTKEEKALLMAVQKEEELLMSKFTEAERRLLGEFEMDARAFVNLFGKDRALRESRDMVMK
eukprot:jgi/Mesvir1/22668/Mv14099-RA.2